MTIETSAPHAPEQDGVAERHIGILLQMARAMLLSSDLPKFLWPEAYKAAAYILNRTPTSALNGKAPLQSFLDEIQPDTDNRPNLRGLRTFGCHAWVHIPEGPNRPKGDKMAARAIEGRLVGYEGWNQSIYRVWIPSKRTVIRCRDVITNDDKDLAIVDFQQDVSADNQPNKEDSELDIQFLPPLPHIPVLRNNRTIQEHEDANDHQIRIEITDEGDQPPTSDDTADNEIETDHLGNDEEIDPEPTDPSSSSLNSHSRL